MKKISNNTKDNKEKQTTQNNNIEETINKELTTKNTTKKKYPVLYTLIILILGIFIGEVFSYYFLVFYAPKHKTSVPIITVTKKDKKEPLECDSYLVTTLLNRFHYDDGVNNSKYLYSEDRTTLENFPHEYVNSIILNEAKRQQTTKNNTFTIPDFEKSRDTVFGDSYLYVIPVNEDFGVCPKYRYNELDGVYTEMESECEITNEVEINRFTTKAYKKENKLYIEEVVWFIKDDQIYKDISSQGTASNKVEGTNPKDFILGTIIDKLNTFKYTFKYNEKTSNYEFVEIEKITSSK